MISSIICPSGPDVEPQGQRNRERLWNIWEHLATGVKEGHKNDCTHMERKHRTGENGKILLVAYAPGGVTGKFK